MNTGIYQITNKINGHCYIGQSINIQKRKSQHFSKLRKNIHGNDYLQRSFQKYGKDNFVFSVLLYCEPFELTRYEQGLVDSRNPEYNIYKECVDSPKGIKRSKETKLKMSESQTGRKHTEETKLKMSESGKRRSVSEEIRKKISESKTGKPSWNKGKKFSDEYKLKMSESCKLAWQKRKLDI